jgi:hypothetical protein
VADEDDRARKAVERMLELFDSRNVEMVRRLVEDEAVDPTRCEERHERTRPLAR